jgi:hypothetical protein
VKGIDTKMPPMLGPYKPHRTLGPIFRSTYLWKTSIMVTPWSVSRIPSTLTPLSGSGYEKYFLKFICEKCFL